MDFIACIFIGGNRWIVKILWKIQKIHQFLQNSEIRSDRTRVAVLKAIENGA